MKYLITLPNQEPFLTNWYDYENNYSEGMIVYDLETYKFTIDGKTWNDIMEDSL